LHFSGSWSIKKLKGKSLFITHDDTTTRHACFYIYPFLFFCHQHTLALLSLLQPLRMGLCDARDERNETTNDLLYTWLLSAGFSHGGREGGKAKSDDKRTLFHGFWETDTAVSYDCLLCGCFWLWVQCSASWLVCLPILLCAPTMPDYPFLEIAKMAFSFVCALAFSFVCTLI
jgi:hypothetical protein